MPHKNKPTDVFKLINMHGGDKDVCWEWKGKLNVKDGRPYITINKRRRPAYAVVLESFRGQAQGDRRRAARRRAVEHHARGELRVGPRRGLARRRRDGAARCR